MEKYVRPVVTRVLDAKGLKEVAENPDFFAIFFVGLDEKTQAAPPNNSDHYGWLGCAAAHIPGGSWNDNMVHHYRKGILPIDIADAATNNLVWRAHCRDSARRAGDARSKVDSAARKAFKVFRRRKGSQSSCRPKGSPL